MNLTGVFSPWGLSPTFVGVRLSRPMGWVGSGQLFGGLGWTGSMKIDPRTTLNYAPDLILP